LLASVLSLALVYLLLWLGMINDQKERTGADFIAFFAASQIAITEGPYNIYNLELQKQVEEDQIGFELASGQILLFNHLPYLIPILNLIVTEDYIASFVRWGVILLAVFLLGNYILLSVLINTGLNKQEYMLFGFGSILFLPFFISLLNGQDTAFLFIGAVLLLWGVVNEKPFFAGIGLSLMTIRPQLAIILAVPFLFQNRKVWWWFLIGCLFLGIFVLVYVGIEGTQSLIRLILITSQGDWYGMNPNDMPTLTGFLYRNLPALSSRFIQIFGAAWYIIALAGLCLVWFKSRKIETTQIGIAFLVSIFFVPYLHYHDLTILLIPIFCFLRQYLPQEKKNLVLLPIGLSYFLLLGFLWEPIRYLNVSISMIILGILLLLPTKRISLTKFFSRGMT